MLHDRLLTQLEAYSKPTWRGTRSHTVSSRTIQQISSWQVRGLNLEHGYAWMEKIVRCMKELLTDHKICLCSAP
jgi:hypothetical protein